MANLYDFIIVGSGSAGCALANRLSTDPSVKVLLLEAGGSDQRDAIRIPKEYFSLWDTDVDWGYRSTPQKGTYNRVHTMPRGKVVGGTSSINGMVYLRGAASDYDGWAAGGCTGWEWESVRQEFDGLEEWLQPTVQSPLNPMSVAMVEAAIQTGLPRSDSFDNGALYGAGYNRNNITNRERFSSYRAFVQSVADRPNLTVRENTPVSRLTFDGTRVTGVVANPLGGAAESITAGEVIVCGGAFNSPHLLMMSGIGPAAHLESLGIQPVADLPVGENLIDHLLIGIVYNSTSPISDLNAYCTEGCAFAKSSPDLPNIDIQISFATTPHFAPEMSDGLPRYTIIPGITQPKSRGTVRLTGKPENNGLAIDPNYFDDPRDMETMIAAVRLSRKFGEQAALEDWDGGEHWPGTEVDSDEQIADYVRKDVSTWFHPVGTCRMGIGQDAVVDPSLRVHGIDGLRVADASIMPNVVSVNTNAASMMIGWKAGGLALS